MDATSPSVNHYSVMRLILISFLVCLCCSLFGQSERISDLKNVIPPSPNAASLGKYAEWPVNLYTGVPSIDIPLYQIQGRSISLPISLSYHASGFKVGEVASSMGLGWSLNAGGMISRSVRSLPDDAPEMGYFDFRMRFVTPDNPTPAVVAGASYEQNLAWIANGERDIEQDIYTLNALGKSYKLHFLANGTIFTTPTSQIKVNPNFATNTWTVVFEDGTILTFGGGADFIEVTSNPKQNVSPFASSWLLKSITSAVEETIDFTYVSTATVGQPAAETVHDKLENNLNPPGSIHGRATCACELPQVTGPHLGSAEQTVGLKLVSTIDSENVRVEFQTSTSREDIQNGLSYARMKVFYKQSETCIDEFIFNTSYSLAVPSETFIGSNSYKGKRLRLNSVERINAGKWTFQYNPQNLPSRVSNAQDHWGYFNGAVQNETLLPDLPPVGHYNGFTPNSYKRGNREPNGEFMKAEILTSITYPTGGYSNFEYEPNSFPTNEEQFTPDELDLTILSVAPFQQTKTLTINLTKPQYIQLEIDANFSESYLNTFGVNTTLAYISLINPENEEVAFMGVKKESVNKKQFFTIKAPDNQTPFVAGLYTLKLWSQGEYHNPDDIYVRGTVSYSKSLGVQSVNKLTGGLRIRSIKDDGGNGNPPVTRTFEYEDPLVLNAFIPTVEYITTISEQTKVMVITNDPEVPPYCGDEPNRVGTCFQDYLVRNASTKTYLANYTTGYGKVSVLNGPNGENGRTISLFSNVLDADIARSLELPFPPPESNRWQCGTLLKQIHLDANLDTLQKTSHYYVPERSSFNLSYLKAIRSTIYRAFINDFYHSQGITSVFYNEIAGRYKLLSTTETIYNNPDGSDKLSTVTNYFYDNPLNLQPIRTEKLNSEGQLLQTKFRTALEKTEINSVTPLSIEADAAINSMLSKNMIGGVLQQEVYKDNVLLNRGTTNYKIFNSSMPLPKEAINQNGSGLPYTVWTVNSYDTKGNPINVIGANKIDKSYIWDYNRSKPIAEVLNASESEIAYTSFEADGDGKWIISNRTPDATQSFSGKASLVLDSRTISLSSLTSTKSYIVSLWARPGATINVNGVAITNSGSRNGWNFYQKTITGITSISITGSGNIDDMRFHPAAAMMTTYCHGPFGISSSSDANHRTSSYEYDSIGRLIVVRDHNGNIVKTNKYNYKQ
jgi:YD repeat-containing protein